jgi:hypothetical protein
MTLGGEWLEASELASEGLRGKTVGVPLSAQSVFIGGIDSTEPINGPINRSINRSAQWPKSFRFAYVVSMVDEWY